MKANKSTKSMYIAASCFAVLMTLSGCIKKRPDQYLQGSGLANGDVVKKEDILNVTESLTATTKLQDATLREYKLTIEDSAKDQFDDLGYVQYETSSELLKNSPRFIGRPGAEYSLRRVLQGNRLLIYKVSAPNNISYIEKTNLVKEFEDGKIGVPFLSFPVSYYVVDYIEDADRRKTNQRRERQIVDPLAYNKATHVLVGWSNRNVLSEDGVDKSSLFPKSFFKKGEWYFSSFKTDSSDYQAGGNRFEFIHSKDTGQFGILRNVKFVEFDQTTFGAVSSTLPVEARDNRLSDSLVAQLKVNWVKLRIDSEITGVETEELDTKGDYRDSEYIQIDFLNSFKETAKNFYQGWGASQTEAIKVSEVIVADNLFSFIVESDSEKFRMNFMRKKESDYKELATFYEDNIKKFGTMYMSKPTFLMNQRLQVEDDFYRYYRNLRFNPDKKTVTYHISEESPKVPAVQKSAERAIKYLDDAFKHVFRDAPEERIRIVLSPVRVKSGDPRYNIIDYNSKNNPNSYGGLGNPYYDENTGEVIAATSFIYYGISEYLLKDALMEYMGAVTGLHLSPAVSNTTAQNSSPYSQGSAGRNSFIYMTKEGAENLMSHINHASLSSTLNFFPVGDETYLKYCLGAQCDSQQSDQHFNLNEQVNTSRPANMAQLFIQNSVNNIEHVEAQTKSSHNIFSVNRRSGVKNFQKYCDLDSIKSIYSRFRGSSEFLVQDEVKTCIDLVLADVFVPTVVHEVLHNFGLDHNMQGSTDKDNYLTPELIKTVYGEEVTAETNPSNTNSIMDYFEYRTEDSPYPSQYDWAVLRYLYRGQIQLSDGKYVSLLKPEEAKVSNERTDEYYGIVEMEKMGNVRAKKFGYCLQAEISWGTNPLCEMFDIGHNPFTIVSNYIEEFDYLTDQLAKKGTRYNYNLDEVNYRKGDIIFRLLKYYQHWRKELITVVGENNKYLEGYKTAEEFYYDFGLKMLSLPQPDQVRILEYYQVRNIIYTFLKNQVFKAPYTCGFEQTYDGKSGPVFLDFDQIYRRMLSLSNALEVVDVTGCSNESVQQVARGMMFERLKAAFPEAGPTDVQYKYLGEMGMPVRDYSSNIFEARSIPGSVDVAGNLMTKYWAATALLPRHYTPYYGSTEYYYPSFLDEPEFRDNFEYFLKNRFVNGFWVNGVTSDVLQYNLKQTTLNNVLTSQEHVGFKTLMNVYGPDGARAFLNRVGENQLVKNFNDGNQDLFNFIVTSPYMQNVSIKDYLNEKESSEQTVEVQAQAFSKQYDMFFVTSYLSESTLIPIISSLFRSGLSVPNDLSISAERTERFLMGISSNDYAYMEYVRNRYKFVADLGSFLVYPKNDKATFARDLIAELDTINSFGKGFADPESDVMQVIDFLRPIFIEHMEASAKPRDFGLGNTFPTVEEYLAANNRFAESLNKKLSDQEFSSATKSLIVNLANQILNTIRNRMSAVANNIDIKAYDRMGNKLNYTEAIVELATLRGVLDSMDSSIPIPSNNADRKSFQSTYDQLVKVVTEFQTTQAIAGGVAPLRPGMGAPDLAYQPIISREEVATIITDQYYEALGRNIVYKFDSQEYDEKKELLNKFLFILATTR